MCVCLLLSKITSDLITTVFCCDFVEELSDGKTLHLLKSLDQELVVATEERINYVPHFHTIVQSGQYEYYASEGQKALRKYMIILVLTPAFEFVFCSDLKLNSVLHTEFFAFCIYQICLLMGSLCVCVCVCALSIL